MKLTPEIRTLLVKDVPALLELYRHLSPLNGDPDSASLQAALEPILAEASPYVHLVAILEGELVASCSVNIVPNLTRNCKSWAVVENVVTHPAFRRRGLATLLLEEAEKRARAAGCYKIFLLSGKDRTEAHEFYRDRGWSSEAKQAFHKSLD